MSLLLKGKTYMKKKFLRKKLLYMDAERTRMVSVAVDAFIKAVNNNPDAGTEPKIKEKKAGYSTLEITAKKAG